MNSTLLNALDYNCNFNNLNLSIKSKNETNKVNIKGDIKTHDIIDNNYLHIIFVNGKNNSIVIGENCTFGGLTITVWGDNNYLQIGDRCTFGIDNEIDLGDGITNNNEVPIYIGDDCMFSRRTVIKNCDGHPIININNEQVNQSKSGIHIGNHVWVGLQSTILKDVNISDCVIIGANAIVTKDVPFNCTVVGINKIKPNDSVWARSNDEHHYSEGLYYYYRHYGFDGLLTNFTKDKPDILDYQSNLISAIHSIKRCDFQSADFWRDIALFIEQENLEASLYFMEIAKKIRPSGPLINEKLDEMKKKLS